MMFRLAFGCRRRGLHRMVVFVLFMVFLLIIRHYVERVLIVPKQRENAGKFESLFVSIKNNSLYAPEKLNRTVYVLNKYFMDMTALPNYEELIKDDENFMVPGFCDGGKACYAPEELKFYTSKLSKKEAFNIILSDMIPYTRSLPDPRNPKCKNKIYDIDLPTVSVVIIFNNEAWSSLMRTIHSVLNRSPEYLLEEIILIDDYSDREVLKGKLDYYIQTKLPAKVRLYRLPKREGLIRARIEGAKVATGDILMFLDAHCEVTEYWLQPLLHRIKEKRNAVVIPIIDIISHETFEYQYETPQSFQVGGFTWSGHFTWIITKDLRQTYDTTSPTRSPTMAGGLFAIERHYFWEIGAYDDQMDVWGGENLELSFRVWQCGGSLETIPCSRIGHIFRDFHPYTFPGNKDTHGINTARMAEVWMDDYKRLFYLFRPDLKDVEIGDLSARKALREKLNCKSFKWYLNNIYPEKFILDENVLEFGQIRTKFKNLCFDDLQRANVEKFVLGVYDCHSTVSATQLFSLSKSGELRREEMCAEVELSKETPHKVIMYKCHGLLGNQQWIYHLKGLLRHSQTGLCIDSTNLDRGSDLAVSTCTGKFPQLWIWKR